MWEGITLNGSKEQNDESEASLMETLKTIPAQLSMLIFFSLYRHGIRIGTMDIFAVNRITRCCSGSGGSCDWKLLGDVYFRSYSSGCVCEKLLTVN